MLAIFHTAYRRIWTVIILCRSGDALREYHRVILFSFGEYLDICPKLPAFRLKMVGHFLPEGLGPVIKQRQSHAEQILIIAFVHFLDSLINANKVENHMRDTGNPDPLHTLTMRPPQV